LESQEAKSPEQSEKSEQEKLRCDLALIEAALYVAGRPLDLKTLSSVIEPRSKKRAEKLAETLIEEYNRRDTALAVLKLDDERFVLQLKPEYTPRVRKLSLRPLLPVGPLKTLSYVAYRQPVLQSQVIDVRGEHAYAHLKELEEQGLIVRERVGKSRMIRTTDFFADYFGLSHELRAMKRQLKNAFEDFEKTDKREENSPKSS
jgi:segregation and condensation protein B